MNRRGITILVQSIVIFGATMLATILAANAEPMTLNCTLIGPKGGETDALKIDVAAHLATWKNETGDIRVQKENILLLGWHAFDVASFDKETGYFSYSFKAADGQRRFTQSRSCRKA